MREDSVEQEDTRANLNLVSYTTILDRKVSQENEENMGHVVRKDLLVTMGTQVYLVILVRKERLYQD